MKKVLVSILSVAVLLGALAGCGDTASSVPVSSAAPASQSEAPVSSLPEETEPVTATPLPHPVVTTPDEAVAQLQAGNATYLDAVINYGDIAPEVRADTAANGQHPYAVVLTCSDSRVPPEHIFSAGVGDLFVIRTAGNVVSDFELGSIEYGAEHLGAKVVVVLGHAGCGAVGAALDGHADGKIQSIVDEIKLGIGDESDATLAERLNITQSKSRILESDIITHLVDEGDLKIVEAKYDISTGAVTFFEAEEPELEVDDGDNLDGLDDAA